MSRPNMHQPCLLFAPIAVCASSCASLSLCPRAKQFSSRLPEPRYSSGPEPPLDVAAFATEKISRLVLQSRVRPRATLHENPPSDRVRGRLRALPRSIDGVLTPYADAYFRGIGLHRESDVRAGSPSEPPPEGRVGRQPRSGVKFSCGDGSGEPPVGAGQRSPTRKAANAQECSRRTLTLPARPLQPWGRTIVQLPGAARGVIGLAGSYKARVDPGPNDGGPTRGPRRTR